MIVKYCKPIKNNKVISSFFEKYDKKIPEGFEEFFINNNGGRPVQNTCFLQNGSEKVVNCFLSFNEEDKENIYKAKAVLEKIDNAILPFASDPSGNYYCIKDGFIYFCSHEEAKLYPIANSFISFIETLK